MAAYSGQVAQFFPAGTVVGAYRQSNWATFQLPPSGAAQGSPDASGTVAADGTLSITGLAGNTDYFLAGQASGVWRYVRFRAQGSTYGLLADRPPIGTVADGFKYFATDDNGGTEYQAQNGAWVMIAPGALDIQYAARSTNSASLGPAATDVPLLTITWTPVDARRVYLHGHLPLLSKDATAGAIQSFMTDHPGNNAVDQGADTVAASGFASQDLWAPLDGLTPGVPVTYKIRAGATAGGVVVAAASPGMKPFIRVGYRG